MIHYHGTPITPRRLYDELPGRNFCVRYGEHDDIAISHQVGQSVMLDNGAFSFWRQKTATDWPGYYRWAEPWLDYHTTWAIIPDVIDGSEEENDKLIREWPFTNDGAPVWHLHESLGRLARLCEVSYRVCIGSSGQYAQVGTVKWHRRLEEIFNFLCPDGPPPVWLHMLRGLSISGSIYPFASADSTDIARNHCYHDNNVRKMADRWDREQCPASWRFRPSLPSGAWYNLGSKHNLNLLTKGGPVVMATINTDELLAKGEQLLERKIALQEETAANREMLRGLVAQGLLKGRDAERVRELYPPRAPKGNGSQEAAA